MIGAKGLQVIKKIPSGWKILPLTSGDLEELIVIENSSYETPWSLNVFTKELANPVSHSFALKVPSPGVEGAQTIIAYLVLWIVMGEGHILNMTVHPDYRRRGVARKLMAFAITFMDEGGVDDVYLEVRRSNLGARRLYESFGFKQSYVRKEYYGNEDAIVMGHAIRGSSR